MKMRSRHCYAIVFACGIFLTGCNDAPIGTDFADDNYVAQGAIVAPSNVQVGFFDLGDPDDSSIAFDLTSKGENVSSTDVLVSFNNEGASHYSTVTTLPVTLNVTMNDVLSAIGKTADQVAVGDAVRFTFRVTTPGGTYLSNRTLRVPFSCFSDLAGEVDYVSENFFCAGGPLTGTVQVEELGAGRYGFSNWSFGTYEFCYAFTAPGWGSLSLNDVCNKLNVTGVDAYGDVWEFKVNSVTGAALNATWSNSYGEFGNVTLTRKDGNDWPSLSN